MTKSTSDATVYELSIQSDSLGEQFTSKSLLYIQDDNNGSYGGGIVSISSSSLANSGRWLSYSEAYITIPLTMTLTPAAGNLIQSPFLAGYKNGWHQLINSCEIAFGNTVVSQATPFLNVFSSFKMLTSFSQDTVAKYGALLNFFPDSHSSYFYNNGASPRGGGVSNNTITPVAAYNVAIPQQPNIGFLRRLYNTNVQAGASGVAVNPLMALADLRSVRRSQATVTNPLITIQSLATIRLKDISDFCAKLPLLKGAYLRLTLGMNTGSVLIDRTAGGPPVTISLAAAASVSVTGRTLPIMFSSSNTNEPSAAMADDVNVVLSIAGGNGFDSACRLYVPAYTMNSEYEMQYLETRPIAEVAYDDIYQYTIPSVASGSSFNQLLTNGVVAPQYVLVCPFVSSTLAGQIVAPYLSPFSSEPGTVSACAINQFQVQLSGKNLFNTDITYDHLAFMGEVSKIGLNGGQTDMMSSGLIGFDEWSGCYRYYVCDLSRGSEGDELVPKSVAVSGVNQSIAPVEYICFIVYKRKIGIKVSNSEIVQL